MHIFYFNAFRPSKLNGGHHGSTSASFSSYLAFSASSFFFFKEGPVLVVEVVFVGTRPVVDSLTVFSVFYCALFENGVD